MKFDKKFINVIFIILFILIILVCSIIICEQNTIKSKEKLEFINDDNEWNDSIIYPENMALFGRNYEGELTVKDIGKSISYVINEVVPKYYIETKNMPESDIKKYFEKNKKSIYYDIGVDKQDEFIDLINEIGKFSSEELKLKDYSIERDTVKKTGIGTEAKIDINYENEETIYIDIEAYNKKYDDHSSVKYEV